MACWPFLKSVSRNATIASLLWYAYEKKKIDFLHLILKILILKKAEGAGQDLFKKHDRVVDASGNVRPDDIGPFLSDVITAHFKKIGSPVTLK
jgi:hypothetical protein